jgi:flavin reductase (DIM6/NTAB) family NADH-FMN oxidoreductase RutF
LLRRADPHECVLIGEIEAGDHLFVTARVHDGIMNDEGRPPLIFHRGVFARPAS